MHNCTEKTSDISQLRKNKNEGKLAYLVTESFFEANSGCNSYKKSGKIGFELNSWINPVSLCRSRQELRVKRGFASSQVCKRAQLDWAIFLYISNMNETSDVSDKYYVYILFSLKDKGLYIGFTTNLRSRLSYHARGEVKSTVSRRPLKLIHYEYFINEEDAIATPKVNISA